MLYSIDMVCPSCACAAGSRCEHKVPRGYPSRAIGSMSFSEALMELKMGKRVARTGWVTRSGWRNTWIVLVLPIQKARVAPNQTTIITPPSEPDRKRHAYITRHPIDMPPDSDPRIIDVCSWGEYVLQPWIGMKMADGCAVDDGFVPWTPSQVDMLAEDWEIVA